MTEYTSLGKALVGLPTRIGWLCFMIPWAFAKFFVWLWLILVFMILLDLTILLGWFLAWYWGHDWLELKTDPEGKLTDRPAGRIHNAADWLQPWEDAPGVAWDRLLQSLHIIRKKE